MMHNDWPFMGLLGRGGCRHGGSGKKGDKERGWDPELKLKREGGLLCYTCFCSWCAEKGRMDKIRRVGGKELLSTRMGAGNGRFLFLVPCPPTSLLFFSPHLHFSLPSKYLD